MIPMRSIGSSLPPTHGLSLLAPLGRPAPRNGTRVAPSSPLPIRSAGRQEPQPGRRGRGNNNGRAMRATRAGPRPARHPGRGTRVPEQAAAAAVAARDHSTGGRNHGPAAKRGRPPGGGGGGTSVSSPPRACVHADAWSPGPGGSCAVGERLGVTSRQAAIRPRILNRKEGSENVWCVSVEEEAKLEPDLASRRS